MRFNVFPGPVCRHSTSPSLDFLRPGLICRTPKVPFSFSSLCPRFFQPPPLSLPLISACRSPSSPFLSPQLCFLSYFNLRLPRQFPFRLPRSFSPPCSPAPTTFRVVYHFSSASGNPLFPIHPVIHRCFSPLERARSPLRISITKFRQSNYSLQKGQKSVCSFLRSCRND